MVFIFEHNLVRDQHSRKRNTLLPGIKVEGEDYEEEKVDDQHMVSNPK